MKRILAIAVLLTLPTTQTKETPWVGDINFPDFY